jgi:hypothetical protein
LVSLLCAGTRHSYLISFIFMFPNHKPIEERTEKQTLNLALYQLNTTNLHSTILNCSIKLHCRAKIFYHPILLKFLQHIRKPCKRFLQHLFPFELKAFSLQCQIFPLNTCLIKKSPQAQTDLCKSWQTEFCRLTHKFNI